MQAPDSDLLTHLADHVLRALPGDPELTYIDAQKILYLTQKRLDSENRAAAALPFYWYLHGPMSKAVSYTLRDAKHSGVVDGRTTATGGQVYTPGSADPPAVDRDEDVVAAERAVEAVVAEYDVFGELDERLREEIYVDAPYEFQRYYKFELLPAVEAFVREPYYLTHTPEEIQFRLARAEGKAPTDEAFAEWRRRLSRFVTLAEAYLETVDESEKPVVETFERLAEDVWELFAKQLRIEEHDAAYADDVDGWKLEYDNSQQSLDDSLRRFEATLEEQFDLYDAPDGRDEQSVRIPEESGWGTVADSLLEGSHRE